MSEEKTITKTRALELAKNVSDALKAEKAATEALATARKTRDEVARAAAAELEGVNFEATDGTKFYIAGVKGGTVGFRKCLPSQIQKAQAANGVFIKLPANTTTSPN